MDADKIIATAVGSKYKPTTGKSTIVMVVVMLITIALAAIPAILARRKAARLAHEKDLLLEEQAQARANEKAGQLNVDIIAAKRKQAEASAAIEGLDSELAALQEKRDAFATRIGEITSWDQLSL